MEIEKRKYIRIKSNLKIGYEFVSWEDKELTKMINPRFSKIFDISVNGICLNNLPDLTDSLLSQLEKWEKKIRLALYINKDEPPLITFARMIWNNCHLNVDSMERYGFVFLEMTESFFKELKHYVDKHLDHKNL